MSSLWQHIMTLLVRARQVVCSTDAKQEMLSKFTHTEQWLSQLPIPLRHHPTHRTMVTMVTYSIITSLNKQNNGYHGYPFPYGHHQSPNKQNNGYHSYPFPYGHHQSPNRTMVTMVTHSLMNITNHQTNRTMVTYSIMTSPKQQKQTSY